MERTNFTGNTARKVAGGLLLLASILLTACNGSSGGDSTPTPTPTPNPNPNPNASAVAIAANMELLVNSTNLTSDGNTPVVVTARVMNKDNVLLEGQVVSFSASNNALMNVINGVTDKTGTATASVTTGKDQSSRTINIKATVTSTSTSPSVIQETSIAVTGTKITINGGTSLVSNTESALTINLKDAAGKGISGQVVTLESTLLKNTFKVKNIPASTVTTDLSGQATVYYVASNAGPDIVKVSALGETATQSVSISDKTFSLAAISGLNGNTQPEANINRPVALQLLYAVKGIPEVGKTVNFYTTRGFVSPSSAVTDSSGNINVNVMADTAGPAQITASTGSGTGAISNSYDLEFIATTPFLMTLQADTSVVRFGASTTVNATVRDIKGNLVKNKLLTFTLSDITGGKLSISNGTTDSAGKTSTTYTAGSTTSPKDGVVITAKIPTDPSVSASTNLTVGGKALFIRLGTGNTTEVANDTQHLHPYSMIVTDAAGNPVSGAQVTLTIVPSAYYKGNFVAGSCGTSTCWVQAKSAPTCLNEDVNFNGILDSNGSQTEDTNGSTALEPGNVASVFDPKSQTITNVVKTDATGSAFVKILYGKNYSKWTEVLLKATTVVEGTEYSSTAQFVLPGIGKDYTDLTVSPPGLISPFGVATSCSNKN